MSRLALILAASLGAVGIAAQVPQFRSSADAVLVDVHVRERGRPVTGLTADDFELRDNGVRQRIQAVTFEDVPVSLLMAFDVSTSVRGETLVNLKAAARRAVAALRPGDEGAVLPFSERLRLKTGWTSDAAALGRTIDGLTASGATSLRDAIFTASGLREEARGRTLVVVFSDGADTTSWLDPLTVLHAARDTDVVVYGVTLEPVVVARQANQEASRQRAALRRWFDSDPTLFPDMLLDRVTEETGGEMLYVASARELAGAFERIIGEFKSRYLLSYPPHGVPENGWHRLEVKLRGRSGTVIARRGYVK